MIRSPSRAISGRRASSGIQSRSCEGARPFHQPSSPTKRTAKESGRRAAPVHRPIAPARPASPKPIAATVAVAPVRRKSRKPAPQVAEPRIARVARGGGRGSGLPRCHRPSLERGEPSPEGEGRVRGRPVDPIAIRPSSSTATSLVQRPTPHPCPSPYRRGVPAHFRIALSLTPPASSSARPPSPRRRHGPRSA